MNKLLASTFLFLAAPLSHAGLYTVDLDGVNIDLTGTIEIAATGTYTMDQFNALVTSFSFTASNNGADAFLFNGGNSTWGSGGFGDDVSVMVSDTEITLSAPTGGDFLAGNLFLVADAINPAGARENLRLYADSLGYRTPTFAAGVLFETVSPDFVIAARVTEPATLGLLGVGLIALGLRRRRT